jgi:VanZ family protein
VSRAAWWWALGWALFIELLLLWPHPPEVPSPFTFIGLDKLVHATLFGVQAALLARALRLTGRPAWPALAAVIAYGAFTEFEQRFVPSRSMELDDFFADTVGALIGVAVFAVWARRRRELFR